MNTHHLDLLRRCESFIAGFDDDDTQAGIPELLAEIRAAIEPDPLWKANTPEKVVRMPAFDIGQRVIVKPTPGSPDPAIRKGGPGTVCHIKEVVAGIVPRKDTMVYVIVDDAQDAKAEPYHPCEIQVEPTV